MQLRSIKSKLVAGFSVLITLIILVGGFSVTRVELLGDLTVKMYRHPLTVTRASLLANVNIIKMHRSMKDVALARNKQAMQAARKKVAEYEQEVFKQYAVVTDRILGKEGEDLIAKTIQIFKDWKPIREDVIHLMEAGDRAAAAAITKGRGAKHVVLLNEKMDALVNYASSKGAGFFQKARSSSRNAHVITISIVCIAAIMGMAIAFVLSKLITRPIDKLHDTIDSIERDSDLSQRIDINSKDEIGRTALSFNHMLEKFEALIQQVISSCVQLASATEKVSAISYESSQNVEQQRSETDQVATAMNEMAATVGEVARNAESAADAANNADNEARGGKVIVGQASLAIQQLAGGVENAANVINQLDKDSDNIGSVLDVIKSIAEQTNLLALNAAIEAARAGEQGRGFAVVADEVRTLAQRTQESTREIEDMIERLQTGAKNAVKVMEEGREQAQQGVEQANEAAGSLDAITRAVATINEMNIQIASAAEEQSAVAEEMNKSVINISQVSEQTANGASETTTAAEEMAGLASRLQSLVAQFKINQ